LQTVHVVLPFHREEVNVLLVGTIAAHAPAAQGVLLQKRPMVADGVRRGWDFRIPGNRQSRVTDFAWLYYILVHYDSLPAAVVFGKMHGRPGFLNTELARLAGDAATVTYRPMPSGPRRFAVHPESFVLTPAETQALAERGPSVQPAALQFKRLADDKWLPRTMRTVWPDWRFTYDPEPVSIEMTVTVGRAVIRAHPPATYRAVLAAYMDDVVDECHDTVALFWHLFWTETVRRLDWPAGGGAKK
jgi:hypothetical protein